MSEADVEAKHAFEKLTEAASTLMDSGELDIYSIPREASRTCTAQSSDSDNILEPAKNPKTLLTAGVLGGTLWVVGIWGSARRSRAHGTSVEVMDRA